MKEKFSHPFPGFLSYAIAVCHPVTRVNIAHAGCIVFDDLRLHSFPTFCRWNVHIRIDINFWSVLPTQPLDFPTLWTQGPFLSAVDVWTEIRQHLLHVVMNCTACIYFPVVWITEKFHSGEAIVHEYFVSNYFNFLNCSSTVPCVAVNACASHYSCFPRYTLMPYV